jgi:hypothetical protein
MASSKDFVGKLRSLRDKDSGVGTGLFVFRSRAVQHQYVPVCDQRHNIKRIIEAQYCRGKREM